MFFYKILNKNFFSSRIIKIQAILAERAYELLELSKSINEQKRPELLLDIGCGSGLSGNILSFYGHPWLGVDISVSMLSEFYIYICSII